MHSEAFRELSKTQILVLFLFYERRQMSKTGKKGKEGWTIINNGEIEFTYDEAEKKHSISRAQFSRALKKLIIVGFIDINHHGGGMLRDKTTYFISDRWKQYGKEAFIKKTLPKDTRNLGFTSENWEERTGKKRKVKSNISNKTVTCSSNVNVTTEKETKELTGNRYDTKQKPSMDVSVKTEHDVLPGSSIQ